MIAIFLISLREGLEAALIVGIIMSYLDKINAKQLRKPVWQGAFAAALVSAVAAGSLFTFGIQLEGRREAIIEGIAMLATGGMLTWIIFWMSNKNHSQQIISKTTAAVSRNSKAALFSTTFFAVVWEGIELTLLLLAIQISSDNFQALLGAFFGLGIAILLGWGIFKSFAKLNIRLFFQATNILLLLFAAGLIGYGVHELNEASVIPAVIEEVWNINHILSDKSDIGLFLKTMFGYNGNPSLTESAAYTGYMLIVGILLFKPHVKKIDLPKTGSE